MHGLLEDVEGVVGEPGVLQDDVPACQSPLDDGTDLVEVGVAREHEEGRGLRAELAPKIVQERQVDPGAGNSCCELDDPARADVPGSGVRKTMSTMPPRSESRAAPAEVARRR